MLRQVYLRMETELKKMQNVLTKPHGLKNYKKICKRIGKLQENYSTVSKYFDISAIPN
jgi:hypothetical protein